MIGSMALIAIITVAFISCKKTNDPIDPETALLMNKNWKMTGNIASSGSYGVIDIYATSHHAKKIIYTSLMKTMFSYLMKAQSNAPFLTSLRKILCFLQILR